MLKRLQWFQRMLLTVAALIVVVAVARSELFTDRGVTYLLTLANVLAGFGFLCGIQIGAAAGQRIVQEFNNGVIHFRCSVTRLTDRALDDPDEEDVA